MEKKTWIEWVELSDEKLLKHCRIEVIKGTGKGGQKRNKTSNHVRLSLHGIQVEEGKSRSLELNRKKCISKMRMAIALSYKNHNFNRSHYLAFPSAFHGNIVGGRILINEKNPMFPMFTGLLIDILFNQQLNWKQVKEKSGLSRTQITRWLQQFSWGKSILSDLANQLSLFSPNEP